MIVLVCGGRYWADQAATYHILDTLRVRPTMIIQGGAKGADLLAKNWARDRGIHCAQVDALWGTSGRAAGMLRNKAMLSLNPALCVALPGGKGTASMVDLCVDKIPVWAPYGILTN